MKRYFMVLCLMLCGLIFNCQGNTSSKNYNVSPEKSQSLLDDGSVQLIDVRKPNEFNLGHIENAVNIDFLSDKFSENISKLNKELPVLIYCRSGRRSQNSVVEFEKAGFTKIYNLEGGILNWKSKGFK